MNSLKKTETPLLDYLLPHIQQANKVLTEFDNLIKQLFIKTLSCVQLFHFSFSSSLKKYFVKHVCSSRIHILV